MTQTSGSSQWLHGRHGAGRNWRLSRKGQRGLRNPPTLSDNKYVLSFSGSASKLAFWFYPGYWLGSWLGFSLGFQIFTSDSSGSTAPEFKTCVKTWVWQHTPITLHIQEVEVGASWDSASLSYTVSSRPAWGTGWDPISTHAMSKISYVSNESSSWFTYIAGVMSGIVHLRIAPTHLSEL